MTKIKTKRTYDEPETSDGFRVLVDRLWPRGIKKEDLHYDDWEKNIAPSTELREWYHQNENKNWEEFKKRYIEELRNSPDVKEFLKRIREEKVVTLLFASKNTTENNALILQDYLEQQLHKMH